MPSYMMYRDKRFAKRKSKTFGKIYAYQKRADESGAGGDRNGIYFGCGKSGIRKSL